MINKNELTKMGERVFHPKSAIDAITAVKTYFICWGVEKFEFLGVESDGWVKGVLFKVNGLKWKNHVLVTLSFMDWYQVRLIDKNGEVIKMIDDICFEELCLIIDRNIESGE
jgi:hypothetical protein